MKYKFVKLNRINCEYKDKKLEENDIGILLGEKDAKSLVMFFNKKNKGDYLIALIGKNDLIKTDMELSDKIVAKMDEYIKSNTDKISQKTSFTEVLFEECDFVELLVEKEKYAKFGAHKGDKGVIALPRATKNQILVDFGNYSEDFDGLVSVEINDLKKA